MKNLKNEVLLIINKNVLYKRIVGNSIILYFDGMPGEHNTKSIWINPYWCYEHDNKQIVDSEDFPWEQEVGQSDEDYKRCFEDLCQKTDNLCRTKLIDIEIDSKSNSICLFFNNNHLLRNEIDSEDEDGWVYRDCSKNLEILAYVDHLEEKPLKSINNRE